MKRRPGQRSCLACHREYIREWRKTKLTEGQRRKNNCKAYAAVYIKRGLLIRMPCFKCGSPESKAHHKDTSKPLEVKWLCKTCLPGYLRNSKMSFG